VHIDKTVTNFQILGCELTKMRLAAGAPPMLPSRFTERGRRKRGRKGWKYRKREGVGGRERIGKGSNEKRD